ncbi:MAG TPA: hypothetical protein VFZ91_00075 [Allosphingosinicella sp.]
MSPKTLFVTASLAAVAAACGEVPRTAPKPDATEGVDTVDAAAPATALRAAVKPVTTGVVVRGVNATPPAGPTGTAAGRTCDFAREEVDQTGSMTGASVQCLPGGTRAQALANLPGTFNSYCAVLDASRLKGRLIAAPVPGNPEHCDLSGIKPSDAQKSFGGAKWR